jgi:putative pyruvate formate lyase activating enzyme
MDQYVPVYKAKNYEKLSRYLYKSEYQEVVDYLYELGFENGWIQTHNLKEDNEVFSTSQ